MSTAVVKGFQAGTLEQHGFDRDQVFGLIRHLGITKLIIPVGPGRDRGLARDFAFSAWARGISADEYSAEDEAPIADYLLDFRRRPPAYWGPYHVIIRDWLPSEPMTREPGMPRRVWF